MSLPSKSPSSGKFTQPLASDFDTLWDFPTSEIPTQGRPNHKSSIEKGFLAHKREATPHSHNPGQQTTNPPFGWCRKLGPPVERLE